MNAIDSLSVWAVRYAMGRATYAVADVADTLTANIDSLTEQSRRAICSDIDTAMARGDVGMDMDRRKWQQLRDTLAAGLPSLCNHWPGQTECDWCRPVTAEPRP